MIVHIAKLQVLYMHMQTHILYRVYHIHIKTPLLFILSKKQFFVHQTEISVLKINSLCQKGHVQSLCALKHHFRQELCFKCFQ